MVTRKESGIHVAWTAISYRSVLIITLSLLAVAALGTYFIFPDATKKGMNSAGSFFQGLFDKIGRSGKRNAEKGLTPGQQEAHFTNIDGTVKVKKSASNSWVDADYSLPLEKGDVVQTSSEGVAKVVFADGTNYTVKQDSLIVIEENSLNESQQTKVAVQVTTGTVDLTTATYKQGSSSSVRVAGAEAHFSPDSSAEVRNDPRADEHQILVTKGSGEVQRGDETVTLGGYEKVSFKADAKQMTKEKEIAPPTLVNPANMLPIFGGPSQMVVFEWTPVANAKTYHLRISRNPFFSSVVLEKKVPVTQMKVSGLAEGAYYWVVQAADAQGKESAESERNRFQIIAKGAENAGLALDLEPFFQHGHVIEIKGRTEPGARVMVNGEEVPLVSNDGRFDYFTSPLPNGENVITITAQNAKGAVNTQTKKIVIQ
ncbi:MAG: hypothetical protein M3O85_03065 [Acidobacteriota bacterium]|nr:hypothetical protein [Acidobacteriota bacterium]